MPKTNDFVAVTPKEAAHMFEVLSDDCVVTVLEMYFDQDSDPFMRTLGCCIKSVWLESEPDTIEITFGSTSLGFDAQRHQFAKRITEGQVIISICDTKTGVTILFDSKDVSPGTIGEVNSYTVPCIKNLSGGRCMVMFQGETSIFSAEEIEEMKQDYLLAKHKERMGKQK